jgi:hypothetical protein
MQREYRRISFKGDYRRFICHTKLFLSLYAVFVTHHTAREAIRVWQLHTKRSSLQRSRDSRVTWTDIAVMRGMFRKLKTFEQIHGITSIHLWTVHIWLIPIADVLTYYLTKMSLQHLVALFILIL